MSPAFSQTARLYHETWRPQFHFTAQKDWINDPNGMVFYAGEYHLFFQRTPGSNESGLKSWGHAISSDMLHWKQLPDAIEPDAMGDIWSGSAVVDWNNTSGFATGSEKVLVAMYTAGHIFGQCLTCSNDRGRTWNKYKLNPVLPHINGANRDPKLVWFEPAKQWVVAIYLDHDSDYGLFTSPDLKHWTKIQTVTVPGAAECPDFFPIQLDGDASRTMWIMTGANGKYLAGTFDGKEFKSDGQSRVVDYGANCYAVQTFSDIPAGDGRRIQIGWMRDGKYPGMPFNQQMSIPCQLTLRSTADGPRLFKYPVKEVASLHGEKHAWHDLILQGGPDWQSGVTGDLFDIAVEFEPSATGKTLFNIRGVKVEYDAAQHRLTSGNSADLPTLGGRIKLRILVDRTSLEVFGNEGEVAISSCILPSDAEKTISFGATAGKTRVIAAEIDEMKSVWPAENSK